MTNPSKGRTMEQADDFVHAAGYTEQVEEYELADTEHVYTLSDGNALIVPIDPTEVPYILKETTKVFLLLHKSTQEVDE